ncbi:uncharacterized protein LAESUDRAFT_197756 [Laetiporus sulphureus 93-53]|uniref:Uncharacterized protein n=1 Tax=Laetiporus sulphureus 93-53 TaxID=1314785 RepID=A0A165E219_9APHY|nr:uncharacterized protein LAESUDRAFT_197756 [Laetiporus sulphureus 93-53]KZT06095.1 hypothetical protein LAESUDRAFT_197756 [Laetiporus sulphureus 93-53]
MAIAAEKLKEQDGRIHWATGYRTIECENVSQADQRYKAMPQMKFLDPVYSKACSRGYGQVEPAEKRFGHVLRTTEEGHSITSYSIRLDSSSYYWYYPGRSDYFCILCEHQNSDNPVDTQSLRGCEAHHDLKAALYSVGLPRRDRLHRSQTLLMKFGAEVLINWR